MLINPIHFGRSMIAPTISLHNLQYFDTLPIPQPATGRLDFMGSSPVYGTKKEHPVRNTVGTYTPATGLGCHFCLAKMYGVAAVQPAASNSPPDCCIQMG